MNQAVQEKPAAKRKPKETGVPDNKKYLHPLMVKNYGKWKYHDRPRPGVLRHVAHSGDQIWTIRAGTQRQMDVEPSVCYAISPTSMRKVMCDSRSAPTSSTWSPR